MCLRLCCYFTKKIYFIMRSILGHAAGSWQSWYWGNVIRIPEAYLPRSRVFIGKNAGAGANSVVVRFVRHGTCTWGCNTCFLRRRQQINIPLYNTERYRSASAYDKKESTQDLRHSAPCMAGGGGGRHEWSLSGMIGSTLKCRYASLCFSENWRSVSLERQLT